MKKITKMLFVFSAFICFSCSGPVNKEYSDETVAEDLKAIVDSEDLTSDEMSTLGGWILGASFVEGRELKGKTYSDILNEAQVYKIEQEALALKAEKERKSLEAKARAELKARKEKFRKAATVSIFDKGFHKNDWESAVSFSYAIQNKSKKDIEALKFSFSIYDKLGDPIGENYSISVTDEPIPVGSKFKDVGYWDYNQFIDENVRIKNTDYEDMVFEIQLEKIVYTDGTVLD